MSNQSEDIQAAGSDTRPPMLDKTDFESWQQRIRLYCKGKDHGEYILQFIDKGPFKMGWCRDEIATGTDGPYVGPERDRVFADLSQAEKGRLRADIRATNILLQGLPRDIYKLINHNTDAKDIWDNVKMLLEGSELTKDDRKSQLYDEFEHFLQHKGENIYDYYQHELHANENKMLMERLNQQSHDPLTLVSKVSPYQYPSSSSVPPQPSYIPPVTYQPQFADNTPLNTEPPPTHEIKLQCRMAGLWFIIFRGDGIGFKETIRGVLLLQEIGDLRTELPKRPQNSDYFKEKMLLMQAQENEIDLDEEQLLFLTGGQTNTFDDDVDEGPI
ncbi:hypothetical protein Tco_0615613 [Tanacetum coccineum]